MSTDSNARISTHSNELFARIGLLLFIWILASAPWLIKIDDILGYFIHLLDPCAEECLNLYQPEKWSELRWIISGLLGFVTIIPIVNLQIWNFSKPGLTRSERKMLRLALILAPLMFLIFSYISIVEILPVLYDLGHDVHTDYGFVVKYDAISLVYFASIVLWAQVLVIVSTSVMISSGITGNLDSDNANWWRLRVYGFVAMVSLLSYYERTSNGLMITLVTLLIIEIISRPWTTKKPKYIVNLETYYDHLGEVISTLKISCNCINELDYGSKQNILTLSHICTNKEKQDDLIKILSRYNPNQLLIFGCNDYNVYDSLKQLFPQIVIHVNQ